MEWVLVKERLPEQGQMVIAYYSPYTIPHQVGEKVVRWDACAVATYEGENGFRRLDMGNIEISWEVTAWMPFVKPKEYYGE
jgi:hypothetical protein